MGLLKKYQIKEVMDNKKILKKLNLFDMSIYNDYFEDIIIKKGERYSKLGKIKNISLNDNIYKCIVEGSSLYDVIIELNNNKLEKMSCTCPYYLEHDKNCKHIYACLYEIKSKNNFNVLNDELKLHIEEFLEFYEKCDKYLFDNYDNIRDEFKNKFYEKIWGFHYSIIKYKSNLYKYYVKDDEILFRINDTIKKYETFINAFNTMKRDQIYYEMKLSENTKINQNKHENNHGLFKTMSFIGSMVSNKSHNNYSEYTDKELKEDYFLDDWQIELVRTGEYGPNNFGEDDEMEPEDYYYDEDEERRK